MNLLLTGSTGFLGKHLIEQLKKNYLIVELSKIGDTQNIRLDKEVPRFSQAFDIVVHSAGKAHSHPKNEVDKNEFFDVNVKGTQNLLKGLSIAGVPKQFVFISSIAVYGRGCGSSISENEIVSATDPYGLSKIQAERVVRDWCSTNKVICTILRLPLLVGKNPPGNLGSMIKGIQKGYYFNVGGGKAKKSMVLAEDVVRFIPIIAPIGGIYNLTDGVHPTFSALSLAIAKRKIYNVPLLGAKLMGYLGDFIGEKSPVNSLIIKKITSDLTFDDSKARSVGWKSQSIIEYLKSNDL
jgi:nucleoside-diphosphate-sugar epimerase